MDTEQLIQSASILLTFGTLLILVWQTYKLKVTVETQNAYNRHETYERIGTSIEDRVRIAEFYPDAYCDAAEWAKYSPEKKRLCVYFTDVLEYMVFCAKLRKHRGLRHQDWRDTLLWYAYLKEEPSFNEVFCLLKPYYRESIDLLDRDLERLAKIEGKGNPVTGDTS